MSTRNLKAFLLQSNISYPSNDSMLGQGSKFLILPLFKPGSKKFWHAFPPPPPFSREEKKASNQKVGKATSHDGEEGWRGIGKRKSS